ncbi:MAG: hypothetical protein RL235_305 [Chlamydiota bacterium]
MNCFSLNLFCVPVLRSWYQRGTNIVEKIRVSAATALKYIETYQAYSLDLARSTLISRTIEEITEGTMTLFRGIATRRLHLIARAMQKIGWGIGAVTLVVWLDRERQWLYKVVLTTVAAQAVSRLTQKRFLMTALAITGIVGGIIVFNNMGVEAQEIPGPFDLDQLATCPNARLNTPEAPFLQFLQARSHELYDIKITERARNEWCILAQGISKIGLTHPQLPSFVVKIPVGLSTGVEEECQRIRLAERIIRKQKLDRIRVPGTCELFYLPWGPVAIVEQMSVSNHATGSPSDVAEATAQLQHFLQAMSMFDVVPEIAHNGGYLPSLDGITRIGVFDLDDGEVANEQLLRMDSPY